ncbi:hypothetical protein [Devosia sp.]|uniref:hypothetical protein n=1 Tax=Devosia sp. TaxID=1871048 RepID=UPI003266F395
MHKSTSAQRKSFKLYAIASSVLAGTGGVAALFFGVSPSNAADFAQTIDAPVAVFMVPLSLLVFAILFEVARITWRGALPEQAPARRDASQYWQAGRGEG